MARLVNQAPLIQLGHVPRTSNYLTRVIVGLRKVGPSTSIGSHVNVGVVRTTRTRKLVAPNGAALIRPASNGANVTLTVTTTTGNCQLVLAVPRAVDSRQQTVLQTCKTRLRLAPNVTKVSNYVRQTRRVLSTLPSTCVLRRFHGPTGPSVRHHAATRRV